MGIMKRKKRVILAKVILAKDLGKKPHLQESSKYQQGVLFICLFQILNENLIPEGKCCPDRYCLFDGTQSTPILPNQTGEVETMGNRWFF